MVVNQHLIWKNIVNQERNGIHHHSQNVFMLEIPMSTWLHFLMHVIYAYVLMEKFGALKMIVPKILRLLQNSQLVLILERNTPSDPCRNSQKSLEVLHV